MEAIDPIVIGERIKKIRESAGLTQEQFADKIGIKRGNCAKVELGTYKPKIRALREISKQFDVSYEYLLGISDKREKRKSTKALTNGTRDHRPDQVSEG